MKKTEKYSHCLAAVFSRSLFFFLLGLPSSRAVYAAITVSGPITASSVTVTGDVMISSMTVSTLTISNLINVTATNSEIPGRVLQIKISTIATSTYYANIGTFTAVPTQAVSIALSNPTNYLRISLSASLIGYPVAYVTIFRDSLNIGDPAYGLASLQAIRGSGFDLYYANGAVGITITDSPGDTSLHTYQTYVRTASSGGADGEIFYPYFGSGPIPLNSVSFLIVEEVSR